MTTNDIILLAGFVALAAGFGYRNLVASVIGWLVLLIGGQIKAGDRITVAGTEGIVEAVNLRCTVLRTLDNVFMYVPNSMWLSSPVIHWSDGNRSRRVRLPVTLPADTDLGRASSTLRRAAEQTSGIAGKPSPRALIVGIDTTGVKLEVWAWLSEPRSIGRTVDELGRNVQRELQGGGPSRYRSDDTGRSRGGRGTRRDAESSDRGRRSPRNSEDRSRSRSDAPARASARSADDSPAKAAEAAESPVPAIATAAEEPALKQPEAQPAAASPEPEAESKAADNGDADQTVSYGRSKRRVPRR